jgi:hypothetical protein
MSIFMIKKRLMNTGGSHFTGINNILRITFVLSEDKQSSDRSTTLVSIRKQQHIVNKLGGVGLLFAVFGNVKADERGGI